MKSSGYFVVLLKESCLVGGNITDYSCFFYLPITFFLRAAGTPDYKAGLAGPLPEELAGLFPWLSELQFVVFILFHIHSSSKRTDINTMTSTQSYNIACFLYCVLLKNCVWSPFFSKHLGSEQRHRFALFSSECSLISSSPVCSQSLDAELCGRSQVCFFSPSENKVYWLIFYILSAFSVWYSIDSCIVTICFS